MIDASPDFREQLQRLDESNPRKGTQPALDGILLTHAHIGHYTGLMHLGREVMNTQSMPVWAMPRMQSFLETHGPWEQLVRLKNVELHTLQDQQWHSLSETFRVQALQVPHRGEYSETVGFVVEGPSRRALYLPDIDKWEISPLSIEELIASVDIAWIDGTFFDAAEVPHRDPSEIPHPLVTESLRRFSALDPALRSRIHFFHFNHTNPLIRGNDVAREAVASAGMSVAHEGMQIPV
jgi:pyrroloquinoline quinone biosynthesis protein B